SGSSASGRPSSVNRTSSSTSAPTTTSPTASGCGRRSWRTRSGRRPGRRRKRTGPSSSGSSTRSGGRPPSRRSSRRESAMIHDIAIVGGGIVGLATARALPARLSDFEPHARALRAIRSPSTGIVDYGEVAAAMARELQAAGVLIETGARVTAIARTGDGLELATPRVAVRARRLVNCAGLYSDVVARLAGTRPDVRIIPFRGEYYLLRPERRALVRGLIYPVPDPEFPFLGVHLTRTVHGDVEAGPNAVLAFAREGYRFARVSPRELAATLAYRGFWQMARRYWRTGTYEMYRSLSRAALGRSGVAPPDIN